MVFTGLIYNTYGMVLIFYQLPFLFQIPYKLNVLENGDYKGLKNWGQVPLKVGKLILFEKIMKFTIQILYKLKPCKNGDDKFLKTEVK